MSRYTWTSCFYTAAALLGVASCAFGDDDDDDDDGAFVPVSACGANAALVGETTCICAQGYAWCSDDPSVLDCCPEPAAEPEPVGDAEPEEDAAGAHEYVAAIWEMFVLVCTCDGEAAGFESADACADAQFPIEQEECLLDAARRTGAESDPYFACALLDQRALNACAEAAGCDAEAWDACFAATQPCGATPAVYDAVTACF